jgi:hypothetical protein
MKCVPDFVKIGELVRNLKGDVCRKRVQVITGKSVVGEELRISEMAIIKEVGRNSMLILSLALF